MMFWIISTGLSAVVAAFFLAVMRAQSAQPETTAPALLIYKQQLQEVEKDVVKGLLAAEEAERLKIEISRRILALDATSPGQTRRDTPASLALTAGLITVTLLGGTFLMYREYGAPGYENLSQKQRIANAQRSLETRPSLEEFAAAIPVQPEVVAPSADYTDLVEKLRKTVAERPDDLEG
ncbi:MAG: c-type cytochrome biogenesis protein CcmI, partial [Paracoccaceae bacterium]